jgi:signal transduction histidine kinase
MKRKLAIAIYALISISLVVFYYVRQYTNRHDMPFAVKGVLDLRTWDFKIQGVVTLDGEWEFYWNRFIPPGEFNQATSPQDPALIRIPVGWNRKSIGPSPYDSFGFATYRLTILLDSSQKIAALKIPEINTAYKMWVNGELVARSGAIGKDGATAVPRYMPTVTMFRPGTDRVEIVVQVSNFQYTHGGIWKSILLSTPSQILDIRKNSMVTEGFLIGALLAIGIYHIGLFIIHKKEFAMLYFGLFCLIIMVRTGLTGERLALGFFPGLPWEAALKIEMLPVYLGPLVFLLFLRMLYPGEINSKFYNITLYAELAGSFILCLLPPLHFESFFIFFQGVLAVICTYCFFVLIRALEKKLYGAEFLAIGYLVLFVTVINDILYSRFLINTGFTVPFGLVFYMLFAFGLQEKFARAQEELRVQRYQLEKADKMTTLGTFVLCVTHDINNPNSSIKITSQELAGMWQDLLPLLEEYREECGEDFTIGGRSYHDLKKNIPEDFARIIRNSERIHHIVNGLKTFMYPEMAKIKEKISINSAVETSVRLFHDNTGKNISFATDLEKNIPETKGRFWDIVQVITNLMQNARDAVNREEDTVLIKTFSDRPNGKVFVLVKDNGIGISEDNISKIQQKFFTKKRGSGNIGLGLFIASAIMKNHDGQLVISSQENKGTEVTIGFNITV